MLEKWAADDLRSVNAQIEFLLRDAVKKRKGGRSRGTRGGVWPRKRRVAWRWAAAAALIALCRDSPCSSRRRPVGAGFVVRLGQLSMGVRRVHQARKDTVRTGGRAASSPCGGRSRNPGARPALLRRGGRRGLRGPLALHLTGLWMCQFDPQTGGRGPFRRRDRGLTPDDENDSVTGKNYRLRFTGYPSSRSCRPTRWLPSQPDRTGSEMGVEAMPVFDDDVRRFCRRPGGCSDDSQETFDRRLSPPDWRVRARRALRVEACDERVPHYYVELSDLRVLHLRGRYLLGLEPDQAEDRPFPSDVFEPIVPPTSVVAFRSAGPPWCTARADPCREEDQRRGP